MKKTKVYSYTIPELAEHFSSVHLCDVKDITFDLEIITYEDGTEQFSGFKITVKE